MNPWAKPKLDEESRRKRDRGGDRVRVAERAREKEKTLASFCEGKIVEGVVTYVAEYGAFVDVGGVGGLLHVTEMKVGRGIARPRELLKIGDKVVMRVLKFNPETEHVSFTMRKR